jgi:hypothetical protein
MAMAAFCSWYLVNSFVVLRAIERQQAGDSTALDESPLRAAERA